MIFDNLKLVLEKKSDKLDNDLLKRIKNECSNYLKFIEDEEELDTTELFYRGVKRDKGNIVEYKRTNERNEKKVGNYLYHDYLISLWDSWKDFPERVTSTFFINDYQVSGIYTNKNKMSEIYLIFPKNETKIGVCPTDDFWFSFDYSLSRLNIPSDDILTFFELFSIIHYITICSEENYKILYDNLINKHFSPIDYTDFDYTIFPKTELNKLKNTTLDSFETCLESIKTNKEIQNRIIELSESLDINSHKGNTKEFKIILDLIIDSGFDILKGKISEIFDPKKNKFELLDMKEPRDLKYILDDRKEMWTTDPVWMIKYSSIINDDRISFKNGKLDKEELLNLFKNL